MPIPTFTGLRPKPEFTDIVNKLNELADELTNLMLNLDSLNVVELNAGTVIVYDLAGGPGKITLTKDGMTINNGTYDTFKVDINGNVTMTSAVIQSQLGYPKITLNQNSNLLQAFSDALNHVDMTPSAGTTPGIVWTAAGSTAAYMQASTFGVLLAAFGTSITLQSGNDLNLSIPGNLSVNNQNGYNGPVYYVKNVLPDGSGGYYPDYGTMTFTKGILTSYT